MSVPFSGTFVNVYLPSKSVTTPLLVPCTRMDTPISASPDVSVTVPVTVLVWESTGIATNMRHAVKNRFFSHKAFFRRCVLLFIALNFFRWITLFVFFLALRSARIKLHRKCRNFDVRTAKKDIHHQYISLIFNKSGTTHLLLKSI